MTLIFCILIFWLPKEITYHSLACINNFLKIVNYIFGTFSKFTKFIAFVVFLIIIMVYARL